MAISSSPEIICIGELLMDLISTVYADDFKSADTYKRLVGGSPANLSMNLARLGISVGLVASVGKDDAGQLLLETVEASGVGVAGIRRVAEPSTLILVTKSRAVSNFEPYRMADRLIEASQFAAYDLSKIRVVHTTAFALSHEPARSVILAAIDRAAGAGARVSTDFNYADKIWGGDRQAAIQSLTVLASLGGLIKMSDVDYERLFGDPVTDPEMVARRLLGYGAYLVCLTLGEDGCFVATESTSFHLPARPVEVVDTTGAGDAFWSGFLTAFVNDRSPEVCARAGRGMAELKLTRLGPVTEKLTLEDLLRE